MLLRRHRLIDRIVFEEPKAEEVKAEEKKEENGAEKPPAEEKKEEPKPPEPFVLFMDLHCVGCAKKIERSLMRIPGVVGVDFDMVKNQVTIKGVVEPQAVCDKITKKTKRVAKVLSPLPAAEGEPIPQVVNSQVAGSITVELNVNMHCEACALQLKRKILQMKGVRTVETEVSSSKVIVTGSMDGEKLVEYVYRRTKKQAKIVPQPEPDGRGRGRPEPEAEKPKEEEKPEEKPAEEAKPDEKPAEEGKKEGGDEGQEEGKKEVVERMDVMDMQRMMYYHQYPPLYVMERIPPPQLFSDENPNACTIS
nr:heavy metal-associated isoprenylated plant protein 9-like [Tanacetum cinerariifolium]